MGASTAGQAALVISGIAAARTLGVHDRGQLALFALVPLLLTVLGSLGLPIATTYFIARDPSHAHNVVHRVLHVAAGQAAFLTAGYAAILYVIFHASEETVRIAAATTLALVPGKLAIDYGGAILQGQRRFRAFNVTRTVPSVVYALTVSTVAVSGEGHLLAVTLCYVVSTTVVGAGTIAIALQGLPDGNGTGGPRVTAMVAFGLRAMLGAVYPTEAFQLDQAVVGALLSRVELGTYAVGVAFSNLPRFLAQAVGLVAYPEVANIADPRAARRSIWRFFWFAAAVSGLSCALLELATPWLIPFLFGREFRGAIDVARLLLLGAFLASVRRVLADGLRGSGLPTLGTVAEIAALATLVPGLLLLIQVNGLKGAALAVPIAGLVGLLTLAVGAARTRTGSVTGGARLFRPPENS